MVKHVAWNGSNVLYWWWFFGDLWYDNPGAAACCSYSCPVGSLVGTHSQYGPLNLYRHQGMACGFYKYIRTSTSRLPPLDIARFVDAQHKLRTSIQKFWCFVSKDAGEAFQQRWGIWRMKPPCTWLHVARFCPQDHEVQKKVFLVAHEQLVQCFFSNHIKCIVDGRWGHQRVCP